MCIIKHIVYFRFTLFLCSTVLPGRGGGSVGLEVLLTLLSAQRGRGGFVVFMVILIWAVPLCIIYRYLFMLI
jgi:hypothetical protein